MALIHLDGFPKLNEGDNQIDLCNRVIEVGGNEEVDNEAEVLTIKHPAAKAKLCSKNVSDDLPADIGLTPTHLDCKLCSVKNNVRSSRDYN
jgi:hypothetical protein